MKVSDKVCAMCGTADRYQACRGYCSNVCWMLSPEGTAAGWTDLTVLMQFHLTAEQEVRLQALLPHVPVKALLPEPSSSSLRPGFTDWKPAPQVRPTARRQFSRKRIDPEPGVADWYAPYFGPQIPVDDDGDVGFARDYTWQTTVRRDLAKAGVL